MAVKSKLDADLRERLCGYLGRGHTIEGATGLCGIHRDTYYGWLERGREARTLRLQGRPVPRAELPFLALLDAVELARNHGEGWLFEQMLDSDRTVWTKFATALERTRPDRWRRRSSTEYTTQPASATPIMFTFDPEKLNTDELDALRVLLAKAAPLED